MNTKRESESKMKDRNLSKKIWFDIDFIIEVEIEIEILIHSKVCDMFAGVQTYCILSLYRNQNKPPAMPVCPQLALASSKKPPML